MRTDPDAPAFPVTPTNIPVADELDPDTGILRAPRNNNGLTKREYFAARAMQGLLSGEGEHWHFTNSIERTQNAVRMADALIAELNKAP